MKEKCPKCSITASNPKPLKYSPDDKYAGYRRKAKLEQWKKAGVIGLVLLFFLFIVSCTTGPGPSFGDIWNKLYSQSDGNC